MDSPIPTVYRVWFASIDPLIALSGALGNTFASSTVLDSYNPKAANPPAIETRVLLDSSSGFLLGTLFLQVVLLRVRPRDLGVWKCLQASIAIADIAIITAALMALSDQGRLDPSLWRWQECGTLGLTGFVLATRLLFLCGIGLAGATRAKWE